MMKRFLYLIVCLLSASVSATDYRVILANSFNESDFEVRMMYRLMNNISDTENILVLTVPAYYADSVDNLGNDVKQTILNNFHYQLNNLIQDKTNATFSKVVAIGRHASVFVDSNPSLFPNAEKFFLHIDWTPGTGRVIPSDYEPELSFRQIMTALPQTKQIILVHGSKELELDNGMVRNFLSHTPPAVDVQVYNPLSHPAETLTALTESPRGTPIIYINYKYYERSWEKVHNWLTNQKIHPVFTIFAHNVSRYTGGAVVVPERLADTATALARGKEVPVSHNPVISIQYNAQQLAQWGIRRSELPPESEFVNEKPSVFSLESVLAIVSFFLVIIILMTIFMLYKARHHNQKMAKALADADSANRSKSDFLANMSHEIRTPMNGVLGTLQILERTELTSQAKVSVSKAIYSAKNLITIINDILDYSKIEANKLTLEEKPFSLLEVADSAISDLSSQALNKGILLSADIDDGFVDGWVGDLVRVKQIMVNLLSNAVKFTAAGSVVLKVSLENTNSEYQTVILEVTDTGVGMNDIMLNKVFERFTQADSSSTRKFGGTGLGMSITQSLVEMMNGSIKIDSKENKGTTVTVELPLQKAEMTPTNDSSNIIEPPDLLGKRILIAEDNFINQSIIESMLEPTKASIEIVENGELAVQAVKTQSGNYDIILMDIQMPVMDGVQACQQIKSGFPEIPVIALTADVMADEIKNYLKLGFDKHIGKPIDLNRLYSILNSYN